MPTDSNDEGNIDELLAELKNETSEELSSKKDKDKKSSSIHEYETDKYQKDDETDW